MRPTCNHRVRTRLCETGFSEKPQAVLLPYFGKRLCLAYSSDDH
jgi:hypothetical protein